MALANVTQEIQAEAEAKVVAIKADEVEQVKQINADADAKIAELKEKEDKRLKDAIDSLTRQELSSAELESKKTVLAMKKALFNQAFEGALSDLESAPRDEKLRLYKAMVTSAKDIIEKPKALMSEKDDFTASELGVSSVEKDSRIASGLILQNEEGTVEVDMQYATLLQEIWDGEIKEVSKILFG